MNSRHDELQAMAAAYVVGALDPDESREFEAHLTQCRECTADVQSLRPVALALAHAVPRRTPPPALRERVLSSIGAGAQGRAIGVHPARLSWTDARVWLPIAAAFVIAAGSALYALQLRVRVVELETRLDVTTRQIAAAQLRVADAQRVALEAQSAMAVLAAPDLARIELKGQAAAPQATARALWSRQRGMVFTVSNLPAAPAGKVYQVWVVTAKAPISAGLLTVGERLEALSFFRTPVDIPAPTAVAVTLEPAGGVPAPTGDTVLVGTPSAGI
jgi:anti-sigma-K factor RskA